MTNKRITNSLSIGIAINVFAFVLVKSINIIIAPVMTSILSPDDFGVLSIYNTWASIIGVIAGLGVIGSLTNFRVKSNYDDYHKYCWNVLLVGILGHLFFLFLFYIAKEQFAKLFDLPISIVPLIAISALTSFCVSFLSTYFIIDNMALYNTGMSLFTVVGSFALSLYLVSLQNGSNSLYYPFIEGHLAIGIIVSIICILYFAKQGKSLLRNDYIKYSLNIGIPLIFHSLAGSVLGSSDRIMIQKMDGLSIAGIYSFTYGFASILSSIWHAINSIWAPFLFKFFENKDIEKMVEKKKNFDFIFTMLSIGFILVYPEVFRLLANERYWGQIKIVPIIVIAFYANHLYAYPANYEQYMERTRYVAMGSIGAALLNILLNFLLIPIWHEYGAAIATALSYIALYIFHLIIAKEIIGDYPIRKSISIIYISMFFIAIVLLYVLLEYYIFRWLIASIIGVVLIKDIFTRKAII